MLIAQCCMDNVVPHVIPFAEHIAHQDWRFRDAAVMSFGCIVDGPDPKVLNQHTWNLIPHLINMLKTDNSLAVRDTCAWTLGRICERLPQTILQHPSVNDLVAALLMSLENDPRVATNACWAFSSLAEVGGLFIFLISLILFVTSIALYPASIDLNVSSHCLPLHSQLTRQLKTWQEITRKSLKLTSSPPSTPPSYRNCCSPPLDLMLARTTFEGWKPKLCFNLYS